MILRIEDLQNACTKILQATDSSELSAITETLELKTEGKFLYLSVTNKEYFAKVTIALVEEANLHATVKANLFLKLISQVTTDCIELWVKDNFLNVKANGSYKLPLVYDESTGELIHLPEIELKNVTTEFNIPSGVLMSIYHNNMKEILKAKGAFPKPVQKYFYLDGQGCITFVSGACVNSFKLPSDVKVLLPLRVVKLFKLFKGGEVSFKLANDFETEENIQTKVQFESGDVCLTAIVPSSPEMISSVPAEFIRKTATEDFPYSITVNRDEFVQAIGRMLLFYSGLNGKAEIQSYSNIHFGASCLTIQDTNNMNFEKVRYTNQGTLSEEYDCVLDLVDLKMTLEGCDDAFVTICFGNNTAVVMCRNNVRDVIPEIN